MPTGLGLDVKGLRGEFFERYEQAHAENSWWQSLCTTIQSNSSVEHHKWLGHVPHMREWGKGRVAKGLRADSYNVANEKYEVTLEVDRDELADDQLGQIRVRTQELGQTAGEHKARLLSDLFINGSTSGYNSYDGVPFFDSSHSSGSSGNQSNEITFDISDTATAGETDDVDAPTPFQCGLALQKAISTMQLFVDDQGKKMNIPASGLVVMCPTIQQWSWMQALGMKAPQSYTMAGGIIDSVTKGMAGLIPNPYLTDTSKFYLLKRKPKILDIVQNA